MEAGHWAEAESIFRRIALERPDSAGAFYNLGVALAKLQKYEAATAAFQNTVRLRRDFPEAWNNLGSMIREGNHPAMALEAFRRAVALKADFAYAWNNLAGTLKDVGQLDASLASFDRALALQPGNSELAGGRLGMLSAASPVFDDAAIFREARRWNDQFARPLAGEIPIHANDPSVARRLRVGYISPYFRRHCQSLFTPPLLANHDHDRFEIFCYNTGGSDMVTSALRRHPDVWQQRGGNQRRGGDPNWSDQDKIDILVDLTLHMVGSRLLVFARKPAPIQVTWLGYPGTTGLDAIDYRFTDPRLDPPLSNDSENRTPVSDFSTKEPYYSERSVRLPDSYWCYEPRGMEDNLTGEMPDPGPLPALATGHVTFGCLNNFCKVTDRTLAL